METRNASQEMQEIFSPYRKFLTWRRIWLALAESQRELGLPITKEQVDALRANLEDIDFAPFLHAKHDVRALIWRPISGGLSFGL